MCFGQRRTKLMQNAIIFDSIVFDIPKRIPHQLSIYNLVSKFLCLGG